MKAHVSLHLRPSSNPNSPSLVPHFGANGLLTTEAWIFSLCVLCTNYNAWDMVGAKWMFARTNLRSMSYWTARSSVPIHGQALISKMLLRDKLSAISAKVPIFTCSFISYHPTTLSCSLSTKHISLVLSLTIHLLNQCSLLWFLLLSFPYNQIISILQTQTQTHLLPKAFLVTPIHQPLSLSLSVHMVTLSMMLLLLRLSLQIVEASIDEVFYLSSNP